MLLERSAFRIGRLGFAAAPLVGLWLVPGHIHVCVSGWPVPLEVGRAWQFGRGRGRGRYYGSRSVDYAFFYLRLCAGPHRGGGRRHHYLCMYRNV